MISGASLTGCLQARYKANGHAKEIAKADKKREKNEEKAMKLMQEGKEKQATKLLKGDNMMAVQLEGKKLNDDADAKNKCKTTSHLPLFVITRPFLKKLLVITDTIEQERAFTDYASKLRADYEREMKHALVRQFSIVFGVLLFKIPYGMLILQGKR